MTDAKLRKLQRKSEQNKMAHKLFIMSHKLAHQSLGKEYATKFKRDKGDVTTNHTVLKRELRKVFSLNDTDPESESEGEDMYESSEYVSSEEEEKDAKSDS